MHYFHVNTYEIYNNKEMFLTVPKTKLKLRDLSKRHQRFLIRKQFCYLNFHK